ncbi:transmembrane protein [Anaeramoeba ignava]|uniref:Transmembrane protein n=1 Tax=Anaeramoeba ignava TaxID=1746090 RepID=A0A9Q0LPV2_ANAIG|nr:transmembrane protein [Anaeramoeba ignava]
MHPSEMKMRAESFTKKKQVFVVVAFSVYIFTSIIVGLIGPSVLTTREAEDNLTPTSHIGLWQSIYNLDRMNLDLMVSVEIQNNKEYQIETPAKFILDLYGKSSENGDKKEIVLNDVHTRTIKCDSHSKCDSIYFIHETFIEYSIYQFFIQIEPDTLETELFSGVTFKFEFYNTHFVMFRMIFGFVYVIFSIFVLLFWTYKTSKISWKVFTFEQKWVTVLLFALVFFNNPFFPITIIGRGWFPEFLDVLFILVFVFLMLLFWLVMFDSFRFRPEERTFTKFLLPKISILFVQFVFNFALILIQRLHLKNDPEYEEADDLKGYKPLAIISIILFVVYLLWLIYSIYRAFREIHQFTNWKPVFYFFFNITIIDIILFAIFVGVGTLHSEKSNPLVFLATYGLFNFYIYTLAIGFFPTTESIDMIRGAARQQLGDDEDEIDKNEKQNQQITSSDDNLRGDDIEMDQVNKVNQKELNQSEKSEKLDQSEKSEKLDQSEKSEKLDQSDDN